MDIALAPRLEIDALAAQFAKAGRVQIPAFLAGQSAEILYRHLRERSDWRQVINSGDKCLNSIVRRARR